MNRKRLQSKIKDISKYLTSKRSAAALDILLDEIKNFEEPKSTDKATSLTQACFTLPPEVSERTNAFALYTDGACRGNPGPGSYAFMIQNNEGEVLKEGAIAEEHTTNNKMEMKAIIAGLDDLANEVGPMNEIYIYTDSKYVVNGMKSWIHNWKKRGWKKADNKVPENVELWKQLDSLSQICHVHFNWIKGHAGHPQNEHVDKLANIVLDENGF